MSSRRKQSKPKSFATDLDTSGQQPANLTTESSNANVDSIDNVNKNIDNTNVNTVAIGTTVTSASVIASTPLTLKRKRNELDDDLSFSHINDLNKTDNINLDDVPSDLLPPPNQTVLTHNTTNPNNNGDDTELDIDINGVEDDMDDLADDNNLDQMVNDYTSLVNYDDADLEESNYNEDEDNLGPLPSNNMSKRANNSSASLADDMIDCSNGSMLMFKCKVCGKAFKHRRSLNRHVKLHSGEKNFKCPFCTTAFARSDHLKAHIRTHNNSKPYRCPICQCGYSTQAALKVHMAHHHSKSKFKCVLCNNLEFHSQLALEGHIYTKHSKENNDINDLINETSGRSNLNNTQGLNNTNGNMNNSSGSNGNMNVNNMNNNSFFNGDHYNLNDESILNNTTNANRSRLADINNIKELNSTSNLNDINESPKNDSLKLQHISNNNNNNNNNNENNINQENYSNMNGNGNEDEIMMNGDVNENEIDEEDDDIIIEDMSPSKQNNTSPKQQQQQNSMNGGLKKLAPKQQMPNNQIQINRLNPGSQTNKIVYANGHPAQIQSVNSIYGMSRNIQQQQQQQQQQQPNTYCELCNARFSNVESYAAHMRNCHPNIPYQQPISNNKIPNYNVLSSVLTSHNNNKSTNQPVQISVPALQAASSQQPPTITKISGGIVIPLNNAKTSVHPVSCSIPNCNCSMSNAAGLATSNHYPLLSDSLNGGVSQNDMYILKETHYTCAQCTLTFVKLNDYMMHLKQEHSVEVYKCILCKQMTLFENLNELKEHFFLVHQSHKYDLFKCKMCFSSTNHSHQLVYNNIEDLYNHIQSVHQHNPRQANGPSIGRQFNNVNPSSNMLPPPPPPVQYMNQNKLFKCNYCDSEFSQQNSLNQHIQMVHKITVNGGDVYASQTSSSQTQQFSCQYCRNTFTNRAQLERHLRIHVSSIDLKCNICDRTFDTQDLLSQHKLTHCKTFEPDAINKSNSSSQLTSQSSNPSLSNQTSTNSNVSAAVCVYCKQTIENELQFKEHFKRHNNIGQNNNQNNGGKASSYICIVCRQTLTSNNEYNLHMRHHLRKNQQKSQQQQNVNGEVDGDANKDVEINSNTNNNNNNNGTNKLKCSKCLVKFEVWQDLVDHMAKAHNIHQINRAQASNAASPSPSIRSTTSNSSNSMPINTNSNGEQNPEMVKKEPINGIQSQFINKQQQQQIDYLCEICSSKFDCNAKLQGHLLIKHEFNNSTTNTINPFTCPVCDETFARANFLLQHTVVHGQAAKIYKCTQCPMAFVFKSQLLNHSFSHLNNTDKTNQANRSYNLRSGNSPAKIMPDQNGSIIPFNHQQQFNQSQQMSNQAKIRPQMVNMNGQQRQHMLNSNSQHVNHNNYNINNGQMMNGHTQLNEINGNIKTYTCDTCFKTFASQRNLNVHVRIHTGFRPFECEVCKRKFTRRENLRSHMKCHLNLRPFPCPICSRLFRRKSHVVSHIEVHIKSRIHNCIECTLAFDTLENYLKHILNVHSNASNGFNKNLITLIQQKSLLEENELNDISNMLKEMAAKAGPELNDNGDPNSNDSLTIQSMIDQTNYYDYTNGEEQEGEDFGVEDDGEFEEDLEGNLNGNGNKTNDDGLDDDAFNNQTVDNSAYDQTESDNNQNQNNDLMNEQELENELQDQLNEFVNDNNEQMNENQMNNVDDDDELMFGNDVVTNKATNNTKKNNHIDFNDNDDDYILNDNDDDVDNLS